MKKSFVGIAGLMIVLAIAFVGCGGSSDGGGTTGFTVTFAANTTDTVTNLPAALTGVASGAKIVRPSPDPGRVGYSFEGWYKQQQTTTAWNFATDTVTSSITLYAKWSVLLQPHTVTFDANAGEDQVNGMPDPEDYEEVQHNSLITDPGTPVRGDGDIYVFAGWFDNPDGDGTAWNFDTDRVTDDITLYAKWHEAEDVSVTFNKNTTATVTGLPNAITVKEGRKVTEPTPAPTRSDGSFFIGWYTDTNGTNAWDFAVNTVPIGGIILYAKWVNPSEAITSKIRRAEVSLGDLSTVDADITLPETDDLVAVSWVTNFSGLTTTGTVSRPSGTPSTGTLTGTFTSVQFPTVFDTKTWNVRVMHSDAVPEDYLVLDVGFDGGTLKNLAPSGTYYEPTLKDNAALQMKNGINFINFNGGYVDLGEKVGALLRKPEWAIEFYVYAPAIPNTNDDSTASTLFSFANDQPINNTNRAKVAGEDWRGTVTFVAPKLSLALANNGRYNVGDSQQTSTNDRVWFGNTNGLKTSGFNGQWIHVLVNVDANGRVNIYRTSMDSAGWLAEPTRALRATRLSAEDIFGSGDPEEYDLRYGYIGKSVYEGSGYTATNNIDARLATKNLKLYGFKAYSKALITATGDTMPTLPETAPTLVAPRRVVLQDLNVADEYRYGVTFDKNTTDPVTNMPARMVVNPNTTITKPALDPTREGYVFTGWYTDTAATAPYTFGAVTASAALYAGWRVQSNVEYGITLPTAGTVNATITANVSQAKEGDLITITVTNNVGYRLSTVKYAETGNSTDTGTALVRNPTNWKEWIFTMPTYNVTITADLTSVTLPYLEMQQLSDEPFTGNLPINTTPVEGNSSTHSQGWWSSFLAGGACLSSTGNPTPPNSGINAYQQYFYAEGNYSTSVLTLRNNRARCIDVSQSSTTPAENQRIGRTFPGGATDYSGYNKISLYVRSMYPVNNYYFSLCNGGVYSTNSSTHSIGTQYRKVFNVRDYVGMHGNPGTFGNDADISYSFGTGQRTPRLMKIVIDLDELVGPPGSNPFDPTKVTGWVFGIEGGSQHATTDTTYNYSTESSNVTNGMYQPARTYVSWMVFEAVQQ